MKSTLLTILLLFLAFHLQAQQYFEEQFLSVWERASMYTLAVADSMPSQHYDFQPEDGAMSFSGQLLHIVGTLSYLSEIINGETKVFYDPEKASTYSKTEIMTILENANRYVAALIKDTNREELNTKVEFRGTEMTKENIFYLIRDHSVHHRGQCVLHLRLVGAKAPDYVGW